MPMQIFRTHPASAPVPGLRPAPARARSETAETPTDSVIFSHGQTAIPAAVADLVKKPELRLGGIPSQRWVVTPKIEAFHQEQVDQWPDSELRDAPNSELKTVIGPFLRRHYQNEQNLTVVELGPATSTTVATELNNASDRYLAVDLSRPYLEKQSEMLNGATACQHYAVLGDTYALPVQDGTADLIVTSCHPPFVSASPQDKALALQEVHRSLKPDGEFLLFPIDRDTDEALLRQNHFQIIDEAVSEPHRSAVLLRKA